MLKCGKGKFNLFYKGVFSILLVGSSLLLPLASYAQTGGGDLPCGGDDPTNNTPCPLDTWVWILAIVTVVFAAVYMQRGRKLQNQA
jgi:hypothetical protein